MRLTSKHSTLLLLAGLLLAAAAGARGATPPIPPTPPDVAAKMSALFAKASPSVRQWVDEEARKLRPMPKVDLFLVVGDARQRFASATPLTAPQAELLAAMALYQTAKDLESEARLKQPAGKGDLSPADLQTLQQLLDRKGQLEAMISNVLKSSYEAGQAAIATLKAS